MKEIKRILVANRGEIACRIFRTVKSMGLESVAVYSDADKDALHVQAADQGFRLGPPPAVESYLAIDRILAAAQETGADAIHPGYGFLSENASFADACAAAGLFFIGPSPATIRAMGSKSAAKALMENAGVPLVPGYHGDDQGDDALKSAADGIGYPLLVKASLGGGGRGMRIVRDPADLPEAIASARREARAAFGDDHLLLERYLEHARHVEVQVFGDEHGNLVHMFERDCSIQRRYQKVIEEAPAAWLPTDRRERLHAAALDAARAVDYVNAGTVEFIVAGDDAFFMEMNTRLQVEHPVTEAVTGLDLVEWQIRIAGCETLPLTQDAIVCNGHAFEARLNAEDPRRGFRPASGLLNYFNMPDGQDGIRLDSGFAETSDVPPFYDSMFAKIIVHEKDRARALQKLCATLASVDVAGIATNRQFLAEIAAHPVFTNDEHDTDFVSAHVAQASPASNLAVAVAALAVVEDRKPETARSGRGSSGAPWGTASGWRSLLPPAPLAEVTLHDGIGARHVRFEKSAPMNHDIPGATHSCRAHVGEDCLDLSFAFSHDGPGFVVDVGQGPLHGLAIAGEHMTLLTRDEEVVFHIIDPYGAPDSVASGGGRLLAPVPGAVAAVHVTQGDAVKAGTALVVVEAMKMEHAIVAPHDGIVAHVRYAVGDLVAEGAELVVLEAASQ
ncbi:MAG: biotin carboxylase N-terminal domain-containing protein [Alphaproteobacteria bacterium]|nr:biotin carboxylase N-terminal domain-containing protein [Alphaproteobacteria bacterium]